MALKDFSEKLEKAAIDAVEEVVEDGYNSLVDKSPVLTGKFKSNWNVAGTQPDESTSEKTSVNTPVGDIKKRSKDFVKNGTDITITNGLPYARRLEFGYSQKSQAMLRRTAIELRYGNK